MRIKADLSLRQVATAPPLGSIKQILDRPLARLQPDAPHSLLILSKFELNKMCSTSYLLQLLRSFD